MGLGLHRLLPSRIRTSYATKFALSLLVLVSVIGGFGYFIYETTGDALKDDTTEQLQTEAAMQTQHLDGWFRITTNQMESIRRTNAFRNEDRRVMTSRLSELSEREAISGAYYVNTSSDEVVVYGGSKSGFTQGDSRTLQPSISERVQTDLEASPDENVVATPAFRTEPGTPVVALVSRMPSNDDTVIVTTVDLRRLSSVVLGEGNAVKVLDERGRIVLSDDSSELLSEGSLADRSFADDSGYLSTNAEGTELAVGYAAAEYRPWTTTTRVPTAQAFSLQTDVERQIVAMLGVTLVGMFLFGVTLGRNTIASVGRLSSDAKRLQAGDLDIDIEVARSDELGDLARAFDDMRESQKGRIEDAQRARRGAEDARQASERFSRHLQSTADEYGTAMEACADGDLTRRLDPDTESEAMASVAESFNSMLDDIEGTVRTTKAFADRVDDASANAATSVTEVRTASEQVTESVQEISIGAERQSQTLQTVADEMEDLSTTTEEIAASSNEVADLAERTATAGDRGQAAAREAIAGLREIESRSETAVEEIEGLEAEVEQVDELIEFITGLAKETNVLALNANIEASRGGVEDGGAGFAVVAEQVKDLAQETKAAAEDIEGRLERIQDQTERTATEVQGTATRIDADAESIEQAVSALDEIAEYARETNDGIQEISAATEQQAATTQEVVASVEEVASISEQTTEEAETAAAAAEQQTANLSSVSETVSQLSRDADVLTQMLLAFDVREDGAAPTPSRPVNQDD